MRAGTRAIQLRQDAGAFISGDQVMITRRGKSVRLPRESRWEAVVELLVRGTDEQGVRAALADGEADQLLSGLNRIDALQSPPRPIGIADAVLERHARTLRFFGQHETAEHDRFSYLERLAHSRVFLLGLGGAGSWIAYQLLLSGVGGVTAADGDVVAASNLNRTALVHEGHLGVAKAAALRTELQERFPQARLRFEHRHVGSAEELAELASGCDLIIGAADTPHRLVRLWVSQASLLLGVPSIQTGGGRVGPFFSPGESSCAGCLAAKLLADAGASAADLTGIDRFNLIPTSTLVPQPCADAALLVQESVRALTAYQRPVTFNAVLQKGPNLLDGRLTELTPRLDCLIDCGRGGSPPKTGGDLTWSRT